jgi:hypothetical protein
VSQEAYFPPGEPTGDEDPRQLLHELWRAHDRTVHAPYSERYVAFLPLLERTRTLSAPAWDALARLYAREHARRRLTPGTQVDWMELALARRGEG